MNQLQRKSIFDFEDIHSHVPGKKRVLSVNFAKPEELSLIPSGQAITVGVHPWNADTDIDWQAFEDRLKQPDVVGLGEAGLDALRGPSVEKQRKIFERQILLAEKYKLPLIIHSVRHNHTILELKKKHRPTVPWIIHGFRGNGKQARQLIDAGVHLSIRSNEKQAYLMELPAGFIHNESDEEVRNGQ